MTGSDTRLDNNNYNSQVKFKMVDIRSRVFSIAGFALSGLAAAFVIASYASPYWVVTDKQVSPSGFERMGLWVACFHNYPGHKSFIGTKRYEGCMPVIMYEPKEFRDHFFPTWFQAVQGMMTVAMLNTLVCVIINTVYFIHCLPVAREKILVLVSTVLSFMSAFFIILCTILFGVRVDQDRDWLPYPDSVSLAWAYGLAILSGFLTLFSGMCMATDFVRLRMEDSYDKGRNPTAAPPPHYDHAVKYRP